MPPTDPTGQRGQALAELRLSLADCTAFRTWCGASNQAEGLAHIYLGALPPPAGNKDHHTAAELGAYRPFVILGTEVYGRRKLAVGTFGGFGSISAYFEQAVPAAIAADPWEVEVRFTNSIDAIQVDLEELVETAGYLCFQSQNLVDPKGRCHPDEIAGQGDHQFMTIQFDWGDRQ